MALLWVFSLAQMARADEDPDALFQAGVKAYEEGNWGRAQVLLSAVQSLVPDKSAPYLWLGKTRVRQNRCADAIPDFEKYLRLRATKAAHSGADLRSDQNVIEAAELLDRCRLAPSERYGKLAVDSTPPGAAVRLDDEAAPPVGVTPYHNEKMAPGSHVVIVVKVGFKKAVKVVPVKADETARIAIALEADSAAPAPALATRATAQPVVATSVVVPPPAPIAPLVKAPLASIAPAAKLPVKAATPIPAAKAPLKPTPVVPAAPPVVAMQDRPRPAIRHRLDEDEDDVDRVHPSPPLPKRAIEIVPRPTPAPAPPFDDHRSRNRRITIIAVAAAAVVLVAAGAVAAGVYFSNRDLLAGADIQFSRMAQFQAAPGGWAQPFHF